MIGVFMALLLGALVTFGAVITIQPGVGALAFCAIVVLTMFAAETFAPPDVGHRGRPRHARRRAHNACRSRARNRRLTRTRRSEGVSRCSGASAHAFRPKN
jgi:paraquat-inducible protein A